MAVKTITSANFEAEVLNAKEPVLVDVWAPWCGPCKMLSPIVDEVAEEAVGFSVGKVNADENQELVTDSTSCQYLHFLYLRTVSW